jgi:23S rRNA (adenine2503-C2)-methyltransferase
MSENLLDFDAQATERYFARLGEKAFRARQVLRWIHQYGESDFARMSDLAKDLRAKLMHAARVEAPEIVADEVAPDGTRKWLLRVDSANSVESVFIPAPCACPVRPAACSIAPFALPASKDSTAI